VSNVEFCLEATGHYWLSLYYHLTELGYKIHVINPIQSDALRNFYVRKTKTDRKDAHLLADIVRFGHISETKLASETVLKLQNLSRLRFEFVRQVGGLKNRVLVSLIGSFLNTRNVFLMFLLIHPGNCLSLLLHQKTWLKQIYQS